LTVEGGARVPRRFFSEASETEVVYQESPELLYKELKGLPSKELHSFLRMFEGKKRMHQKMLAELTAAVRSRDSLAELRKEKDALASVNQKNEERLTELQTLIDQQGEEGPEIARRWESQTAKSTTFALSKFAKEALEILDNLQRSQASLEKTFKDAHNKQEVLASLQAIQKNMEDMLAEYGIRKMEIKPRDPVDPNFHHIITFIPFPGWENDEIVDIIELGYNIGERVLRPAKVVVVKN
jgi:molecular chaperone GrpE